MMIEKLEQLEELFVKLGGSLERIRELSNGNLEIYIALLLLFVEVRLGSVELDWF